MKYEYPQGNNQVWAKITKTAGILIAGAIGGAIIMARIKEKTYKELLKQHDKETAKRMSKEFNEQLKQIRKEYKDNEEQMKRKMKDLCKVFGVDPEVVFDV